MVGGGALAPPGPNGSYGPAYAPGYTPFELAMFGIWGIFALYIFEIICQMFIFILLVIICILKHFLTLIFSKQFNKSNDGNALVISLLGFNFKLYWLVRTLKYASLVLVQVMLIISCFWWVSSIVFLIELLLVIIMIACSLCYCIG